MSRKPPTHESLHGFIHAYLAEVSRIYVVDAGGEHTYRTDFEILLRKLVPNIAGNEDNAWRITHEPSRKQGNAPDFDIRRDDILIGYFETKQIGDTDLRGQRDAKNKEQFTRYKYVLGNVCFTDYLHFIFFDGETEIAEVAIAHVVNKKIVALPEHYDDFINLVGNLCKKSIRSITTPPELAINMANHAKHLAFVIENSILQDEANQATQTSIWKQYQAFSRSLVHELSPADFADSLAQTIVFGLFTARRYDITKNDFYRGEIMLRLPESMPFLREFFAHIVSNEFDLRINVLIDNLLTLFLAVDMDLVFADFGKNTEQEDPIIHFYENFLALYNPKMRKARGVWYTPKPVVNFIVRAVDDLLIKEFNINDGLADRQKIKIRVKDAVSYSQKNGRSRSTLPKDTYSENEVHRVQILDPATGTGAFLSETFKHILKGYQAKERMNRWNDAVENDILPRLHGFEILMASYAIAHLHMRMELQATGYVPTHAHQRMNIYLTNALENYPHHFNQASLPMFDAMLALEAIAADKIKHETPVMVVMGNPPYSGESSNTNINDEGQKTWIGELMDDYKKEPGGKVKLKERNPKWINDDYVKFLRMGQHYLERNKTGILAYINPHGFLDNPTFRGMRWNLLHAYDKIYTINLHGNSKKKEKNPQGGSDENVFDIMQGVSINLFIKTGKKQQGALAEVFHCDLYGKRDDKYAWLMANNIKSAKFERLPNVAPNYFFVPKNFKAQDEYDKGFSIKAMFKINSVGIVTSRDDFVIDNHLPNLKHRINDFFELSKAGLRAKYRLKENGSWKIDAVKKAAKAINHDSFSQVVYRPFDIKHIYFDKYFIERSRLKVMQHFFSENLGLVYKLGHPEFKSAPMGITQNLIDFRSWSRPGMQGGDYVAPLYLYPKESAQTSTDDGAGRVPNINAKLILLFAQGLGLTFTPEKTKKAKTFAPIDLLDYIYATLHSPSYREKYKEFLKIDFPKVPYPSDIKEFWRLVELGGRLRQLHLLENIAEANFITSYPVGGAHKVEKIEFRGGDVWINEQEYFKGVPAAAWNFYIGGYQPAQKWLKDRKGLKLTGDETDHYQKIIYALNETAKIMAEIG